MLGQTVAAKRADGGDLLYSTLVASGSLSNAGVTQVNKSFDSHYDAQASYGQRMTRWMPWLGLAVGLILQATLECANHGSVENDFVRSHHRRYWKTVSIDGNGMRKMMVC